MSGDGVSRAEFTRLMERAVSEVEAGLRAAGPPGASWAHTVHDWWEHLSEVVMPQLLLEASGEP